MSIKPLLLCITGAIIIAACSTTKLQKYPAETCAKLPGDKTFSIIKDKCYMCHKGDFATREMICTRRSMILSAVSSKRMPKIGSLNDEQLNTILKWDF